MRALPTALLLLPLAASPAFGQGLPQDTPVVMRLRYTRAPGAEACPDEDLFRSMMRAHVLRSDPLAPNAPRLLSVLISRRGKGYESFADLRDDTTGNVIFTKAYPPTPRCVDATEDLARGVAIEIERPAARRPPVACHTAPLPSSSTLHPPPPPCWESPYAVWPEKLPMKPTPAPPPPPPERWPIAIRLGAAVWPEVVASGFGSLGLSVDVGVRYRGFSASAEFHGDPPLGMNQYQSGYTVSFARVSGALLLCAHWEWFVGCGVADAGRFIFPNHIKPIPASAFYGAAGARVGLDFPVPPRLFLRAALDLRAPIEPVSYKRRDKILLTSAGLGFGLVLGVVVELP